MIAQVIIENGQKKIIPLTADAGAGNPVGTLIHTYKKSNPSGYLYCDGSTFDQTKYPLLYAYLGSNVLPDYRECVEVGAEQNTTDTIATHDVYTEGQFKDDQLQDHTHSDPWKHKQGIVVEASGGSGYIFQDSDTTNDVVGARTGTTTHGKQKAVFVYIKATSGLSENAQDNVINTLNEERSYSTEEVNTGKKWIDGKPIYRKVETVDEMGGIKDSWISTGVTIPNVETLINVISLREGQSTRDYIGALNYEINNSMLSYFIVGDTFLGKYKLIIEYTKTTD